MMYLPDVQSHPEYEFCNSGELAVRQLLGRVNSINRSQSCAARP